MDWLKSFVEKFDIQRWWTAAFFAGLAILVTGIAAKDDCFKVISLGIMSFGWGEWLNHRMETEIRHGGTLTTYERVNRPLGLVIAAVGIVVVALGLYCLFASSFAHAASTRRTFALSTAIRSASFTSNQTSA